VLFCAATAAGQGPAPETAPPLFPGGAFVSYKSIFTTRGLRPGIPGAIPATARPTFSRQGIFNFTWGFYKDFDVTVLVPVITNRFDVASQPKAEGTGIGDAMLLLKYRFLRADSARGTTQASVTVGPKLPSGRTDLTDASGHRLPAGLQPGSGSADVFLGANFTYTGLFNVKRLVADEDFHTIVRSEGIEKTRLGSDLESRFWLSYRPYESTNGAREWFIGPTLTYLHFQNDRLAGVMQTGSGGDVLLTGITTYVGVRPGMHLWLDLGWDVAHSAGPAFMPVRNHISFGITQQFRMPL
jgi:hypothetical protein